MGIFGKKKKQVSYDYGNYDGENMDDYSNAYQDTLDEAYGGAENVGYDNQNDDPYESYGENQGSSKKKKKSGSFDPKSLLAIVAVLIVVALLYTGVCSVMGPRHGECKYVITEFQEGINELDAKRFINVLDPRIKRIVQVIFIGVESATDIDISNAFEQALNTLCSGMLPSETGEPVTDLLKQIEIVPVNYGIPGLTRSVKCKVQFDGVTYKYIRIKIKKFEGEPYISSISLIKDK